MLHQDKCDPFTDSWGVMGVWDKSCLSPSIKMVSLDFIRGAAGAKCFHEFQNQSENSWSEKSPLQTIKHKDCSVTRAPEPQIPVSCQGRTFTPAPGVCSSPGTWAA